MAEKTKLEKLIDASELMTTEDLEAAITQSAKVMNAHTNAAEDARKEWLVLRDEQKRRMRK